MKKKSNMMMKEEGRPNRTPDQHRWYSPRDKIAWLQNKNTECFLKLGTSSHILNITLSQHRIWWGLGDSQSYAAINPNSKIFSWSPTPRNPVHINSHSPTPQSLETAISFLCLQNSLLWRFTSVQSFSMYFVVFGFLHCHVFKVPCCCTHCCCIPGCD